MYDIDIKKTVAEYGVSKERLYQIARVLDRSGHDAEAREVRAAGDFIKYATDRGPGAATAFHEMLAAWQREPRRK